MTRNKVYNYRVLNPELNCNCGHKHHSRDSAIRCADELGWVSDIILERFDSRCEGSGKGSLHHRGNRYPSLEESRMRYFMMC